MIVHFCKFCPSNINVAYSETFVRLDTVLSVNYSFLRSTETPSAHYWETQY